MSDLLTRIDELERLRPHEDIFLDGLMRYGGGLLTEARDEIVRLRAEVEALKSEVGALADHLHDASPAIPITRNDIDRLVKAVTRQPRQPQPCPHGCYPVNGHLRCEPCATGMEE